MLEASAWALRFHQPVTSSVAWYPPAIWLCEREIQSAGVSALFLSHLSLFQSCSVLSHPSFTVVFGCFPLRPDGTVPSQRRRDPGSSGQQMFRAGRRSGAGLLTSQDHTSGLTPRCFHAGRAASLPCVASALAKDSLHWPGA